jgi:hypothetical protein
MQSPSQTRPLPEPAMASKHARIKRSVRTIGLFSPAHCLGLRPSGSAGAWLYERLKAVGFRKTVWQFVYSGQLGGLILPLEHGLKEIHVRFYRHGIEAELEAGRSCFDHFLAPRVDATDDVLSMLRPHLAASELPRARASFHQSRDAGSLDISRAKCPRFTLLAASASLVTAALFCIGLAPGWAVLATLGAALFVWHTLKNCSSSAPSTAARTQAAPGREASGRVAPGDCTPGATRPDL